MILEQMTQALSFACTPLSPASMTFDNTNAFTVPPSGDGVDMLRFGRVLGMIDMGVGTPNNGTAKIYGFFTGSNTNNGTYSAFSTNTSVTINTNNSQATLELRGDQLPTGNRYIKFNVLVPIANAILGAKILGEAGPYKPVSQFDYSTNTALLNRTVTPVI